MSQAEEEHEGWGGCVCVRVCVCDGGLRAQAARRSDTKVRGGVLS